MMPPPAPNTPPMRVDSPPASNNLTLSKTEPSITEIMKFPSKVVLLRVFNFSC